jgi:hypothetical protein
MTDLRSAIYDDIDWYIYLCEYFNEEPRVDKRGVDPYCEHRYELGRRHTKERERSLKKKKRS